MIFYRLVIIQGVHKYMRVIFSKHLCFTFSIVFLYRLFFLAGFHKNLIASGIQQDLSFIFQVPVPSSIEKNPLSTIWKYKFCSGVKRNSYLKKDSFFLPFPAGFIKTSGRVIRTPAKPSLLSGLGAITARLKPGPFSAGFSPHIQRYIHSAITPYA